MPTIDELGDSYSHVVLLIDRACVNAIFVTRRVLLDRQEDEED